MTEYEKESKIETNRYKFNKIKEYASSNNWFVLDEFKEDDDNWPQVNYLTPSGLMVEVSFDDDHGVLINNELGGITYD